MTADGGLLLDTHVWIWAVDGSRRELSAASLEAIEAQRTRNALFVSAVSVREVVLLAARGRLQLSLPAALWTRRALAPQGLRALALDAEAAALSASLPGTFHRDPADQMLVATAMVYGFTLATRDRAILDYGAHGHLVTLDATPDGLSKGKASKRVRE